ncbi:hypothetical protein [Tsukamurella sp. 1534]|uniref:hypothetical protein n=1 Tax=Tsukamurella sp. 1534 TaxID=1151061 RepID=UPI00031257B9|nr:hypothetical protein [Tsukamurella sp. 1534]
MTAPIVDSVTDLEEQLSREIPCDTRALKNHRGADAEHGPARWLLIIRACDGISVPICEDCAAVIREWIAAGKTARCLKCGRRAPLSEFFSLKEL